MKTMTPQKLYALKAAALCLLAICVSCKTAPEHTFTDPRDGKTYRTVKIGKQTWMAENLNYQTDNSWCYEKEVSNCKKYGRLYSWDAALDACPAGWHLPYYDEWEDLVAFAGGDSLAGTKLKSKSPKWGGTDNYGFSATPGGERTPGGYYHLLGSWGGWWTANYTFRDLSFTDIPYGLGWQMDKEEDTTMVNPLMMESGTGLSVRCLKGPPRVKNAQPDSALATAEPVAASDTVTHGSFTDTRDGKTYRTVEIGGKTWMAENLNYEIFGLSWCYDDKSLYCEDFGRLYIWDAAMKACPAGWHLPTKEEWETLISVTLADGSYEPGKKLRLKPPNWDGTDDLGFSAMPGGCRYKDGNFDNLGTWGGWWTATAVNASVAHYRYTYGGVMNEWGNNKYKNDGLSVRCLRD
jgi:uncharacterized protein (TIGR02145 family)